MQSLPFLLRNFSFFMNLSMVTLYALYVFWMGGYVMKGYAGFVKGPVRIVGRIAFGLLALVCGIGISSIIPPLSSDFFIGIIQDIFIDPIIGIVISTVILYVSLKMVSHDIYNIPGIERAIKRLESLKKKAADVEKKEKLHKKEGIRHPIRLGGVVLLAVFLIASLLLFQGFPNPMDGFGEFGFDQDDLDTIADQVGEAGDIVDELPDDPDVLEECMKATAILQDQATIAGAEPYRNTEIETLVEERTGENVAGMYTVSSDTDTFVLVVTATQTCLTTMTDICICQDTQV